jgi:phosphoketolase
MLRDTYACNADSANFRLFCPDETNSNRLGAVFEVENRCFVGKTLPIDDHVAPDGRVMEVLSEHLCEGWLEGYLLSGRHGLFASYEAFAMIPASMVVQQTSPLIARRMRAASLAEMPKPESVRQPRTRRDDGLSRTPRGLRMALNLYSPL